MVYLMRHGLDDENYVGGFSDISLIDIGREQVRKGGRFIRDNLNVTKIVASDIVRCVESAEIVKGEIGYRDEIVYDKRLRELDKGTLTGLRKDTLSEAEKMILNNKDIFLRYPKGESMFDLFKRVKKLWDDGYFVDKDNYLITTHRGVINMLYFITNNEPLTVNKEQFMVEHGSIHELDTVTQKIKRIF